MAGYTGYSTSVDRPGAPITPQGNVQSAPGGYQNPTNQIQQLQQFGNLYNNSVIQPVQQQGQYELGNLADQGLLNQMQAMYGGQQAQQNAGFEQQNLGLSQQGLAVQQGALSRQMDLLPQQFGLQNQGFDLAQQQANYGAMTGMRDLNSSQTARGAFTSGGANAHRGDINQNLAFQTQGIGLQRQGAGLNFKENQAQQQDAQKQLDIQSKRLGISGQEIKSRLDNALAQLGISSQVSANQILREAGKVQQGMISPYSGFFGDLSSIMGIPLLAGGQ